MGSQWHDSGNKDQQDNSKPQTKQFKNIKWENLDEIDKNLTPIEKSLIMDFKNAVLKKQIIEFLAGKETEKESEEK